MRGMEHQSSKVGGVILAAGRARRMGALGRGDKGMVSLAGKTLLEHVCLRVRSQVDELVINTHHDVERFASLHDGVVQDRLTGFLGPLAGLHTAMHHFAARDCALLASFAVDTPFVPLDFVSSARAVMLSHTAAIVQARCRNRIHPTIALWRIQLLPSLEEALMDGIRKIDDWSKQHSTAYVAYDARPFDPFFNINSPNDLKKAQEYIK